MVSRIFTLAGVATLMGIAIAASATGCSNDEGAAAPEVDAGAKDAARDGFVPPPAGDDDDEPVESCISKEPMDAKSIPYAKALRSPGACSSDEVKALVKYFDEQEEVSVADWAATVSDTCAACVFTATDAEEWGPVLVQDDKLAGVNRGGCIELASKSETCGRAYEQAITCMIEMCLPSAQGGSSTCSTAQEVNECITNVVSVGACAEVYAAANQECGEDLGDYEKTCGPTKEGQHIFEVTIPVHCGGTPEPDAGADG